MAEPTTTLDSRFSDPSAQPTSWAETEELLEKAPLFWITTVRADGRPHSSPLVAVWHDGALHFSTGADEQKAVNLRHNAHVILTTGCNQWEGGVDVIVEGDAVQVTDATRLKELATAWRTKWDGRWRYEVADSSFRHEGGNALVFAVTPTTVLAFGKGVFSHTSHRF
jgi:general stress protein 26